MGHWETLILSHCSQRTKHDFETGVPGYIRLRKVGIESGDPLTSEEGAEKVRSGRPQRLKGALICRQVRHA
jgi:hypothetical protein